MCGEDSRKYRMLPAFSDGGPDTILLLPHHDVRNAVLGVLEKMRVRTIGVKNVLTEQLAGKPLPLELFLDEGLRTKG